MCTYITAQNSQCDEKVNMKRKHFSTRNLKVLSSEMDPAELGSFDRYLLKRVAWGFLEKSARPPSCESPLVLSLERLLIF
jgi:hypothetical protein